MKLPADWAIQKALNLGDELFEGDQKFLKSFEDVKRRPSAITNFRDIAFARYIEDHEEAPVDLCLIRAREIYAEAFVYDQTKRHILEGKDDKCSTIILLIKALKEPSPCS